MNCATHESNLIDLARGATLDADRADAIERHMRGCRRCAERFQREQRLSAGLRRVAESVVVPPWDAESERQLLAAFDVARLSAAGGEPAHTHSWLKRPIAPTVSLALTAAALALMVANRSGKPSTVVPRPSSVDVARGDPEPVEGSTDEPKAGTSSAVDTQPSEAPPGVSSAAGRAPAHVAPRSTRPRPSPVQRTPVETTAFVMWPGANELPTFESGQLVRVALPGSIVASLGLKPPRVDALVQADVLVGQDGYARAIRLSEDVR